jgi:hypothetical protein
MDMKGIHATCMQHDGITLENTFKEDSLSIEVRLMVT